MFAAVDVQSPVRRMKGDQIGFIKSFRPSDGGDKTVLDRLGWKNKERQRDVGDAADPEPVPVLYGLLDLSDVRELRRRRSLVACARRRVALPVLGADQNGGA